MPEETAVAAPSTSSSSEGESFDHGSGSESGSDRGSSTVESSAKGNERPKSVKKPSAYFQMRQARKAFKAERETFQREREAFALERAQATEAAKPKPRDYTVDELRRYRQDWENEGRYDLVQAADKELAKIEAEEAEAKKASSTTVEMPRRGTPEHKAMWDKAEAELAKADPEFMREGTRLDTKLREIMAGENGDAYRGHPRGIIAAYHQARMELLEADLKDSQTENSKLKDELRRYQGYTSIGGGAPGRVGNGSKVESIADFAKLSTKDMRAHLLKGANRDGAPWF